MVSVSYNTPKPSTTLMDNLVALFMRTLRSMKTGRIAQTQSVATEVAETR